MRVEIVVRNAGRSPSAPLVASDDLPDCIGGPVRLAIPSLQGRSRRLITYQLVPSRRGLWRIGPGRITFTDPFGLAQARPRLLGTSTMLVYPRVESLSSRALNRRVAGEGARSAALAVAGTELFTMREYQPGDDLRKLHWRSTARTGKLIVRQEEVRRWDRATILVDNRRSAHPPFAAERGEDSFERVIESAASLLDLFFQSGLSVRLVWASGPPERGPGSFSKAPGHYHRLMEQLALARLCDPEERAMSALMRPGESPGLLAIVTSGAGETSLTKAAREPGPSLVICHLSTGESAGHQAVENGALRPQAVGASVLRIPPGARLGSVWSSGLRSPVSPPMSPERKIGSAAGRLIAAENPRPEVRLRQ